MFCEYGMSTVSIEENGLSISLEHDLSTERNLCSAAGAALVERIAAQPP